MSNGSLILREPILGLPTWRGDDLVGEATLRHELATDDVFAIEKSLASLKQRELPLTQLTRAGFPMPSFETAVPDLHERLENGRGFFVLSGLPIDRFDEDDFETILYGIGQHLGSPVCQDEQGTLVGKVENVGDLSNKNTRVYETNQYLPYHADPSDVFSLLCIRKAKAGGLTSLVSSAAIYNRILTEHPEYLGLFYRPLYYAHLGEAVRTPIFSHHEGKLASRYLRQYIELGHEMHGAQLSRMEVEALDLFDSILADETMRFDLMLEPGDMIFANNYAVMHSRNEFEDAEDPARRRKLLRLWLKMPNARELSSDFPGRNGYGLPV